MNHRLLSISCVLMILTPISVNSIACYSCTSVNTSNPDCEDPMSGNVPAIRPCRQALRGHRGMFNAVYCSKIKGLRQRDGTSLVIRHCAMEKLADVLVHRGQFVLDDDLYDGDITTCTRDWCNRATNSIRASFLLHWPAVLLSVYSSRTVF